MKYLKSLWSKNEDFFVKLINNHLLKYDMDGKRPSYFIQEGFLDMCEMDLPNIGLNSAESILFYEECKENYTSSS